VKAVWSQVVADISDDWQEAPGSTVRKFAGFLILDPLLLVILYRFSHAAYLAGRTYRPIAYALKAINLFVYGADIHPGATLGRRVVLAHPVGVVIGGDVVAGDDLTLEARVAIGGNEHRQQPRIGDGVFIHTGACVAGNITIGDRAVIGANAVVLKDVPSEHVAVGVPARHRPRGVQAPSEP
jgi:serine O-acetyltransferase